MALAGRCAKALARTGLHRLGLIRAFEWYRRDSFQILAYHRFNQNPDSSVAEILAAQCAYMRRHFTPVAMSEIGYALRASQSLPRNALAITIDDGYRDFLSCAFPVFEAYGIPVTVYLITDFVDGKMWPWWDQVDYAVRNTAKSYVEVPLFSNVPQRLPILSDDDRRSAVSMILGSLTKVSNQRRLSFVNHLAELFETEIPSATPCEYAALTWDDARMLESKGVELGAHTRTLSNSHLCRGQRIDVRRGSGIEVQDRARGASSSHSFRLP